jgi:rhamnosyltransferase
LLKVVVVIPTLNAASNWQEFAGALLESAAPQNVLILDSESSDSTAALASAAGFRVHRIPRAEFNHGATRQLAVDLCPEAEVLVYLTQDAILAESNAIATLVEAFRDPEVMAAYGRQLPRQEANPIEAHGRLFNYSDQSNVRALASREQLGFKAIFISNSFAAYRRDGLIAIGGFPCDVIFGEDTVTAAKLLLAGWKVAYVAESRVFHSHRYTWRQDFRRYFDIGVLHSRESWLVQEFGSARGEGARFVRSELHYLWPQDWWLIPSALARTALKLIGYRLGKLEANLSLGWKRRLSMHPKFWR